MLNFMISFQRIYHWGSGKELVGNIEENIGKHELGPEKLGNLETWKLVKSGKIVDLCNLYAPFACITESKNVGRHLKIISLLFIVHNAQGIPWTI